MRKKTKYSYVLVGNGIACIGAIEGIRRVDRRRRILAIGSEATPAYGRPLISYVLAGKVSPERLALRPEEFFRRNAVDLKLSTTVVGLDPKARTLRTDQGETIIFGKVLIATGGIPFAPAIEGREGPDVYNFTSLADAQVLIERAKELKRAVVVGGGLIGLKAAESLTDRGVAVEILELSPRILSLAFDENAARLAGRRLAEAGITVRCGVTARTIVRDTKGRVTGVTLSDGRRIKTEAVVIAIGVVPNFGLAREAGLDVDKGILVDERLRTSAANVFAAGDVAQAPDLLAGENRVIPVWSNAYNQGFCAGKNMAGAIEPFVGALAMNSISFYGLPTVSVGLVNPPAGEPGFEVASSIDERKQSYRKLVFKEDRLVGYVLVGDIDRAGQYTAFIKFKLPVAAEAKARLIAGDPNALLWPDEFFAATWNPQAALVSEDQA